MNDVKVEGMPTPSPAIGGRRTGPKPRFTVNDAVDAALKLGLDTFTLGDVAAELGVSTPSLYRIAASRAELVELALIRVAASLVPPPNDLSWQEQLRDYVESMWGTLENHPGIDRIIMDYPGAHAAVQGYLRDLSQSVLAAGFPGDVERLDFVIDFLGDTVIATHLSIVAMRREVSPGRSGLEQARDKLKDEAAASGRDTRITPHDSWVERGHLDAKVEFILSGVEAGL